MRPSHPAHLLTITAALEVPTGLALLAWPSLPASLLLGSPLDAPGQLIARIAGAALLALGTACWLARRDAHTALIAGMLLYNASTAILLSYAAMGLDLSGPLVWPAALLHAAMAFWCALCLRSQSATPVSSHR